MGLGAPRVSSAGSMNTGMLFAQGLSGTLPPGQVPLERAPSGAAPISGPLWASVIPPRLRHTLPVLYHEGKLLSENTRRFLLNRGVSSQDCLAELTNYDLSSLPDPERMHDMRKARSIILEAVSSRERVAVVGDYDADGITGATILASAIQNRGGICDAYTPCRLTEGYGLNTRIVDQACEKGSKVLIGVDLGTLNKRAIAYARSKGLRVVVFDHHIFKPGEEAVPDALVNPHHQDCGFAGGTLTGAGLAWMAFPDARLLPFAAIGTVADVGSVRGVNRTLLRNGMRMIRETSNLGLRSLVQALRLDGDIVSSDLGFGLGPHLNAIGRIEMNGALRAIEMFLSSVPELTSQRAHELVRANHSRKALERSHVDLGRRMIEAGPLLRAIVIGSVNFHPGIAGLQASRFVQRFARPTAVVAFDATGRGRASVRGVKGGNVHEALERCAKFLDSFGGHEMAGGFSIRLENLQGFAHAFAKEAERQFGADEPKPSIACDFELTAAQVARNTELWDELAAFEPFGSGFEAPIAYVQGLTVRRVLVVRPAHLKVVLGNEHGEFEACMWNSMYHPALVAGGDVPSLEGIVEVDGSRILLAQTSRPVAVALRHNRVHLEESGRRVDAFEIVAAQLQ